MVEEIEQLIDYFTKMYNAGYDLLSFTLKL